MVTNLHAVTELKYLSVHLLIIISWWFYFLRWLCFGLFPVWISRFLMVVLLITLLRMDSSKTKNVNVNINVARFFLIVVKNNKKIFSIFVLHELIHRLSRLILDEEHFITFLDLITLTSNTATNDLMYLNEMMTDHLIQFKTLCIENIGSIFP